MNVSSFKDTFTVDFLGKKERFSRLQVEQDTWEQDNFDDCCYNLRARKDLISNLSQSHAAILVIIF